MSHLLATMNPDAAAGLEAKVAQAVLDGEPVMDAPPAEPVASPWRDGDPDVSDWVIYQPRRGMIRRGRNRVAALVVHRHPDARLLDLAIFYEANDTLDDQRVPEATGEERGWLVKAWPNESQVPAVVEGYVAREEIGVLRQDIADLRTLILGDFNKPEHSVLDLLSMLDERVDVMERAAAKPKRKRGRPAKAKVTPAPAEPKAE